MKFRTVKNLQKFEGEREFHLISLAKQVGKPPRYFNDRRSGRTTYALLNALLTLENVAFVSPTIQVAKFAAVRLIDMLDKLDIPYDFSTSKMELTLRRPGARNTKYRIVFIGSDKYEQNKKTYENIRVISDSF